MEIEFNLTSNDWLTRLAKQYGLTTWNELTHYIQHLPYARTSERTNLSLVFIEGKGTCSSKHALLKEIAHLNGKRNISLLLGIYKMNGLNTPKIGKYLKDCNLQYIPEAHCYLKVNGKYKDYTAPRSDINQIKLALIEEIEIQPKQVNQFKVQYHKAFLENWIKKTKTNLKFEEIWKIRENCINKLSEATI